MSLLIPFKVFYIYRTPGDVLTRAMAFALYGGRLLGWNGEAFPYLLHCGSSYKKHFVLCVIANSNAQGALS